MRDLLKNGYTNIISLFILAKFIGLPTYAYLTHN